jgi:glycerol-1-phosphate dehydrogenase [NAD(P)+]
MSLDATRAVVDNAKAIKNGDADAYGKLIYGLLMSGIAMQLLGNSRCASGAEHHISHLIEMQPEGLAVNSDALHGEKVGVGTLLAASEYHKLKNSRLRWGSFTEYDDYYVRKMFGDRLSDSIIEENKNNCISMISSSIMEEKWGEICGIIDDIPTYDELIRHYRLLGAISSLEEIGVPEERLNVLLEYSPLVRNRLTLMRLRRLIEG